MMDSAAFASTIKAKYPQYANVDDDDLVRAIVAKYPQYAQSVDMTVAEQAGARLAARGLSGDAIKANPALAVSSPDDFRHTQTVAQPGVMDYLGAAGGALARMIPTSDPTSAMSIAQSAAQSGAAFAQDYVQAAMDFPNAPVRRTTQRIAAAVPLVGGIAHDILQPSFVAPEREPRPDERLSAMGAAVQAGTLALPAALKGSAAAGPRIAAAAERSYAGITEPPLTESMARQMMDRRMVVRDGNTMRTNAVAAEQAALDTRGALARDNPLPNRWRSTPARREAAQQIMSAEAEAKFQADLQVVADTIKAPAHGGNILTGTAGRVLSMIPGVDTAARVAGTIRDLQAFPKTAAYKSATALAKRDFGHAMSAADHALAADIGAAIASGALAVDEFGHRAAVRALSAETEALPTPELRRQAIAGKTYAYADPDGRVTEIPRNVLSGFVNAVRLTEGESPLGAWLAAMGKRRLIKPGGSILINGVSHKQSNPG